MYNFEDTDLKIAGWEIGEDQKIMLFILLDKKNIDKYDLDGFMNDILSLELLTVSEEEKDKRYEDLLDRYGIIEVFDQEEISELSENGNIDPDDLHYSLYKLIQ